jgi:hypothetical protein
MIAWILTGTAYGSRQSSPNFTIRSSVLSGGGGDMGSANFNLLSTAGQSTPLMNQDELPFSMSWDLYPGFWYTVGQESSRVKAMPWLLILLED